MTMVDNVYVMRGGWNQNDQCRINHVADVANATGLRPQGASGNSEIFFSPSVVK